VRCADSDPALPGRVSACHWAPGDPRRPAAHYRRGRCRAVRGPATRCAAGSGDRGGGPPRCLDHLT